MTDKQKNVPYRRFKEFENADAWERRKLGELGSVAMNKRIFKNQTSKFGEVPFYKIGTFGKKADSYITQKLFKEYKQKYPFPEVGDVLISASGSIGRTITYKGQDEYFQDSNIVWLNHDGKLNNKFLKQFYLIVKWQGLEGSTIKRLYNKNILNTKIRVPTPKEQQAIGDFFDQLDHLIALHQRKYDKLKKLKSAYLSEMFPAKGERKPKRRFPGFADAWEQRKFSEIFDYNVSNNTISRSGLNYETGKVKNIHYGDILVKFGPILNISNNDIPFLTNVEPEEYKSQLLRNGDIVIADTAEDETAGKALELTGIQEDYVVSGLHTIVARPNKKFARNYLGYYLNSPSYHKKLLPLMQGIKVLSLNKANIAKTKVIFPKELEEQKRIGYFFDQLDHFITLHQQQLEKLKSLKQAYLNEMFV